jgi:hypothetical protein
VAYFTYLARTNREYQFNRLVSPTKKMDLYDDTMFNSLVEVNVAAAKVRSLNGENFINTKLKELFEKYSLNETLAVALCHRHFDLKSDEIMVERNDVATPWAIDAATRFRYIGTILPLSWVVWHGQLRPYEFYFSPEADQTSIDIPADFAVEFDAALRSIGLEHLLALRVLRNKTGELKRSVELQERYATFTVPWESGKFDSSPDMTLFQTTWEFRPGAVTFACYHGCGHGTGGGSSGGGGSCYHGGGYY